MPTIYRVSDASLRDLSAEEWTAMQANPVKAAMLRLWVPTAQPAPTATQKAVSAPAVIDPINATQAWVMVDKTQAELDAETSAAEKPQLAALLAALTASIQAPDVTGTAAERLVKVEARILRLERIARYYVRGLQ